MKDFLLFIPLNPLKESNITINSKKVSTVLVNIDFISCIKIKNCLKKLACKLQIIIIANYFY